MMRSIILAGAGVIVLVLPSLVPPAGGATRPATPFADPTLVNRGVVELETAGSAGISVSIAEDLANLVDDGATRRLIPVIGKGSLQILADLRFLRGIDVAIVQTDVLDYAKEQRFLPGIEASVMYITKLYNEEFHLLARPEIKSIADLANQNVNVDLSGSGTAITASRLFGLLKLTVAMTTDNQEMALEKLRKGEIAALAFVAGKRAPFFRDLKGDDGLHLLAIPLTSAVTAAYAPTRLTEMDYPGLVPADQPVETIAVGSVLLAADLRTAPERYRNVANFVEAFFTGFQSLLEPGHHAKWQEVNLSADYPGWLRYPPAQQWLQRNTHVASALRPEDLRAMFARFIDERRQAAGRPPMTGQEKNDLFEQFRSWQSGQAR